MQRLRLLRHGPQSNNKCYVDPMQRIPMGRIQVERKKETRPIVQRCILSVLRYAFCDGGGGGVGGGGGGGGDGSGGGSGGGCGILTPRMIPSS